jgi:outer membrane protein OmpA-like peptidoglycan-associated protein
VLLLTFSDIGRDTIPALRNGFRRIMPGFKLSDKMYRSTLSRVMDAEPVEATLEGSEHTTLEQGKAGQIKESAELNDPYEARVFMIPANKIFAGRAAAISPDGRRILDTLAAYLKRLTNGVIISAYGAPGQDADNTNGLARASAVKEYLTTRGGLEQSRFGISAGGTEKSGQVDTQMSGGVLEIVLLGQGINK